MTKSKAVLLSVTSLSIGLALLDSKPLAAQGFELQVPYRDVDANGVGITSGSYTAYLPVMTIGDGDTRLEIATRFERATPSGIYDWTNNFDSALGTNNAIGDLYAVIGVNFEGKGTQFNKNGDGVSYSGSLVGDRLRASADNSTFFLDLKDGRTVRYDRYISYAGTAYDMCKDIGEGSHLSIINCQYPVTQITYPTGKNIQIGYDIGQICYSGSGCTNYRRSKNITTNFGASILFGYDSDQLTAAGILAWTNKVSARMYREGDAASERTMSFSHTYNTSNTQSTATTPDGDTWTIVTRSVALGVGADETEQPVNIIDSISTSANPAGNITFNYNLDALGPNSTPNMFYGTITQFNRGYLTTNYARVFNYGSEGVPASTTTTISDATGRNDVYVSQENASGPPRPNLLIDALSRQTSMTYDAKMEPSSIDFPEHDKTTYERDAYSNIVAVRRTPKPNSPLAIVAQTAAYPADCTEFRLCARPLSVTNANGGVTEFTYSADHAGILTQTDPADANGLRAVKRHFYTQRYAWVSNGAGGFAQAASPIWLRTQTKTCRTSATTGDACSAGTADEVIIDYDYGPDTGASANYLLLRGVAVTADGRTERTCYGFDSTGNRISETKPRAGVAACY